MDLSELIYRETSKFPSEEKYGLTSQIRRASTSIPSNIAEGSSRYSQKEFKHFLSISLGSAFEVGTQVELANRLSILDNGQTESITKKIDELEKMIIGFMKSIN